MSQIAASAFKGLAGLASPLKKTVKGAKAMGLDFSGPELALGAGVPTAMFAGEILGGVGSGNTHDEGPIPRFSILANRGTLTPQERTECHLFPRSAC